MPDLRRATCQRCRGHRSVVGPISWSGLCQNCAIVRVADNVEGMALKHEPHLLAWRRAVAASVGAVLLDDLPPRP